MRLPTPHTRGAGYFANNVATSRKEEADVRTCVHCECVILMQKWKDDGGFCSRCMAPICGPCSDRMLTFGCEPAMKRIERVFEMTSKLAQFRKIAGL